MDITSAQNSQIKRLVKLRDDKRQRAREGMLLIEGRDELMLALRAGWKPESILTAPELATASIEMSHARVLTLSRAAFEKISYREKPDGWLGVFPIPKFKLEDLKLSVLPLVLLLESIEKPGNLGAILRTADAARVDAVLVCDSRVDVWNPNVVRASRGALCSVRTIEVTNAEALTWLRVNKIRVLAATPEASVPYTRIDLRTPLALAFGTEDAGLTDFWLSNSDARVSIPMAGLVNSLNVSVATALITYEALRQRSSAVETPHAR